MFDHRYIEALELKIDALITEVAAMRTELSAQRRSSTLPAKSMQKIDELHRFFRNLRP